ncbi:MAG TPA: cytochrome P450 [Abditibacterium sp.]|jgi:cytochrome P450
MNSQIPEKTGHWLFGSARQMQAAPHLFPMQIAREIGQSSAKMARFRILRRPYVACASVEAVRHVLVTRHENYPRSYHHRNGALVIGDGLLANEGDPWLKRRRLVLPAFKHENLDELTALTAKVVDDVLGDWNEKTEVDALKQGQRITIGTIHRALFSCDIEADQIEVFARATRDSLRLVRSRNLSPFPIPTWIPTPANRAIIANRELLDNFVGRHIEARLQLPEDEWPTDILTLLLRAKDPESGASLDRDAVQNELKTLFVAGFETTASTLAWALYCLAKSPEIAAQWHREADEILGDAIPNVEALQKLEWTAAIVHETLRLYPTVYNLGRLALQDDTICGQQVRRGDILLLSIYGVHHDPDEWEKPMEFHPQRFLPGQPWNRLAFMPFAAGKHQCIGNSFAFTELMVSLVAIARRFEISLPEGFEARESAFITLTPDRDIPLQIKSRY